MRYKCVIFAALTLGFWACGSSSSDVSDSTANVDEAVDTISQSVVSYVVEDVDVPDAREDEPSSSEMAQPNDTDELASDESSQQPKSPEDMVSKMMGMLSTMMGGDGQQVDPDELMKFAFGMLGEAAQQHQQQQEKIRKQLPAGWEDWPVEDVTGIYVKISAWDEEDAARISRDYYEGSYISDGWSYYARTSLSAGVYPITIGTAETSRLFHINGSKYYIYFDWLSDVDTGDVGVYDNTSFFRHFYKKPK